MLVASEEVDHGEGQAAITRDFEIDGVTYTLTDGGSQMWFVSIKDLRIARIRLCGRKWLVDGIFDPGDTEEFRLFWAALEAASYRY